MIARTEVVLSVLLTHFRFKPGKSEIEWVHTGIYQPTVNGVKKPSMPIKLEVIRQPAEEEKLKAKQEKALEKARRKQEEEARRRGVKRKPFNFEEVRCRTALQGCSG